MSEGLKVSRRLSRKNVTIGVELPHPVGGKVFVPLGVVPRNTSKYKPHQGKREMARRLKQQEQQ